MGRTEDLMNPIESKCIGDAVADLGFPAETRPCDIDGDLMRRAPD